MFVSRLLPLGFVLSLSFLVPASRLGAQDNKGLHVTAPMASTVELASSEGPWLFRKQVNEVTVMFTATRKGKFVDDLQKEEIQVQDDKKDPESILDFRSEADLPLRLGLLIDTSGSVDSRFHFEQEAAAVFLRQVLEHANDQAFVAGFSSKLHLSEDLTNDAERLAAGAKRLKDDQGDTALFDAIGHACHKLAESPEQQPVARVLVVLSDGADNASHSKLPDAVSLAQSGEVTIFTVSTMKEGLDPLADHVLNQLAEETGGRQLHPGSPKDVAKAFGKIRDEIRNRYAISYRPARFKPDGHFRKIKIIARKFGKKLHVQARKGYYAR